MSDAIRYTAVTEQSVKAEIVASIGSDFAEWLESRGYRIQWFDENSPESIPDWSYEDMAKAYALHRLETQGAD